MNYNFIKENLHKLFSGPNIDKSALEVMIEGQENSFILNHNIEAVSKIIKFLSGEDNIFILNGFMGSGKTYCADFITNFIDKNVLIFKNSYQEAINLDDVFLSMFKDFSGYHNEKLITLPKIDTNIFSEKINSYIKYCNSPMLFIFDSFEIDTRSRDTQKDILDFINFISRYEKVKVIICSRTFKKYNLINKSGVSEYNLDSLLLEEAIDYIDKNQIEGSRYDKELLYNEIRGHYVLLELSVVIMKVLDLSVPLFYSEYKKFYKNFMEFLVNKIVSTTSDKYIKLLLFLSAIRHGVSSDFLVYQELATIEDLNFLAEKHVIAEKYDKYYIKDYIKNEFIKTINNNDKISVHEYIISLYQQELPLKPFERQLFLSRQTMRQEIAFHQQKINVLSELIEKTALTSEPQDFNYLSYSLVSGYDENKIKNNPKRKSSGTKFNKNVKFNFDDTELLLMNGLGNKNNLEENMMEISSSPLNKENSSIEAETEYNTIPDSIDDYIKIAKSYEDLYNYSSAILYYKKALTYKKEENYKEKEIIIYERLANCYKKIQDAEEAAKYYEALNKFYVNIDNNKANQELLNIARMYAELYKFDLALEYYKKILSNPNGLNIELKIRIYLDLAELEDNNMNINTAAEYAIKALSEAQKTANIKLLCECYYKYGIILDESGSSDAAVKNYLRCIQTSNNPNENIYIASAYSNLAEISIDNKNISAAKMYYELSVEADKVLNNNEGLYYSYSKLALLNKKENPEKTYELLLKALSAAKKLDDVSYSASVYIELGDYYLSLQNYKSAIKAFIFAKTLLPAYSSDDTNKKLNTRLSRIKTSIGEVQFMRYVDEIKKKK